MLELRLASLALLVLVGCQAPGTTPTAVPAAQTLRLVPDPGPRAPETPPTATLWRKGDAGWQPEGRVTAIAPGGRALIDADRRLIIDGAPRLTDALPDLRVAPDGAVYASRSPLPPASDVWRIDPDGAAHPVTSDGASDRPFPLPDGRLLWVSGAGGVAGFVIDGERLTNRPGEPFVPVPARHAGSRVDGDRFIYDAGDGEWWLDLTTGKAGRR